MKTFLTYLGTAIAALAASACCWIPALLGAGAAGSLGVSAALAPWRPYLLGLTVLFLAGGFWMVYRKPKGDCCGEEACASEHAAKQRSLNIGVMWAVALFSVPMAAYPNYLAATAGAPSRAVSQAPRDRGGVLTFKVKGMDCEACAAPIKTEVEKVPGIVSAAVDFKRAELRVEIGDAKPGDDAILAAVKSAGFSAEPIKEIGQ
ncbi:MAG: hypothetical protein HND42_04475 [Armatimonadetes bacterium]|nr:hypothetical protein [Armatimonadota bacterium]NOG92487.1 hypothetical protein [Armatimonadota bacterium]